MSTSPIITEVVEVPVDYSEIDVVFTMLTSLKLQSNITGNNAKKMLITIKVREISMD